MNEGIQVTFIIGDIWNSVCHATRAGITVPIKKRSVVLELEAHQIELLDLKCLGKNSGRDMYEEILECFVEHKQ